MSTGSVDKYASWDAFCASVFDECGKSGQYLRMLYGAGGMAVILVVVSMLGFSPFVFITWLLGFLITPWGIIVAAVLGAMAVPALKHLFSERKTLEPMLKRLTEAKHSFEAVLASFPDTASPERKRRIDALFRWVIDGGIKPSFDG